VMSSKLENMGYLPLNHLSKEDKGVTEVKDH